MVIKRLATAADKAATSGLRRHHNHNLIVRPALVVEVTDSMKLIHFFGTYVFSIGTPTRLPHSVHEPS